MGDDADGGRSGTAATAAGTRPGRRPGIVLAITGGSLLVVAAVLGAASVVAFVVGAFNGVVAGFDGSPIATPAVVTRTLQPGS
jgi:hypothetical protein